MQEKELGDTERGEEREPKGIERYRMIYREVKAEEIGGLTVFHLAELLRQADEDLKEAGKDLMKPKANETLRNRFRAQEHDRILRRWKSELAALGSLMDPNERKRIETEVEGELYRELEKAAGNR